MPCAFYLLLLARFVTTAQQDHHHAVPYRVIDTVPLACIDPEFADPSTDCSVVAKITFLDTVDANDDPRLGALVTQSAQPTKKVPLLTTL